MKRLLIALSALTVSIPTVGFARSFDYNDMCWSTDDGSYLCFDKNTGSYSVQRPLPNTRELGGSMYGACGGTFVYDGTIDWVLAAHYHYSFCKERAYPLE